MDALTQGLGCSQDPAPFSENSDSPVKPGSGFFRIFRIGEGFDDERLDTLFLTLPISWRGTLSQYAGRLHRIHHTKKEAVIYDYVDWQVPVLARMYERRVRGYRSIGYKIEDGQA